MRGPEGELTYAELADKIDGAARHLRGRGIGPGALAAVGLADPVELLVAALAADLAGATPLVGGHTWDRERWAGVTAPLRPDVLIDRPLPPVPGPPVRRRARPEDLAWACFSSGSTGRPRAIVRTRASWTASYPQLNALTGIGADDVVLVPGPLVSSLYAFAALHALGTGATAVVPGRWPGGALAAHLADATVVHLVPHRLPDVLEHPGSLRVAVVGGAALTPGARQAADRAGVRVVAYYGAAELSFVAVDADGGGLRPFPGVEIEVRDLPGGRRGGRLGEVGALALAGRGLPGRCGRAAAARRRRLGERGRRRRTVPGRAGAAGAGRGDGAIQTGGATVVPEDVEEVLRRVPGVGDVVVVGSPHPSLGAVVTAIIETGIGETGQSAPPRALLEATARCGLDVAQRPRRWYAVPSLPRTPTGKPARAVVAGWLSEGRPGISRLS
ncbi:AMP-binding protein [Nonomuraea antimicrobica]